MKRRAETTPEGPPRKRFLSKRGAMSCEASLTWAWWKEKEKRNDDGAKWRFLEHRGPLFPPDYKPLPAQVKLLYDGRPIKLSLCAEEAAGFYARTIGHECTRNPTFKKNFFADWRDTMTSSERNVIRDLRRCNFSAIVDYYDEKRNQRKLMSREEKNELKEANEREKKLYGLCTMDGRIEKVGNYRIEPPGLFHGRGDHPKLGSLKPRIQPEDVIINCHTSSVTPNPPAGHRWKEVRCDNKVGWLARWTDHLSGQIKYVMLNSASRLKGEKDVQKFDKARELAREIDRIRDSYMKGIDSTDMQTLQRAVAIYFIDHYALRAGNEKDPGDHADTVGCCSLRREHLQLFNKRDGKSNVVLLDFLGKDSIRYKNQVSVSQRVFESMKLILKNKMIGDKVFDRLNTSVLNRYLGEEMEGLTTKVFRTYNASHTFQEKLDFHSPRNSDATIQKKILAYNRANRAVALVCNHRRAIPKTHRKMMENLDNRIRRKGAVIKALENTMDSLPRGSDAYKKKRQSLGRLKQELDNLELLWTDKNEGKGIALGTSKLNYLDPRITVAWCKRNDVPVDKIYNAAQRAKFQWALSTTDENYRFD